MEEIKSLPRCYSFSFNLETMTLFFKIQRWIVPAIKNFIEFEALLMEYMYKKHGGDKSTFINFGEKEKPFGYNNSMTWDKETETEIIYSYTFGPVNVPTEEICEKCEGTKLGFSDHPCHNCHGTGKKHIPSSQHFSEALLSLYPILKFANCALQENCYENNNKTYSPQTNEVQTIALEYSDTTGICNCSMFGWIDDRVAEWLKNITPEQEKIITRAMQKTEEILLSKKMQESYFTFNWFNDDYFYLQAPGNACTLGTSSQSMGMFGNVGRTLEPHNIDHRFQQTSFLVALAVMNDMYEEYLRNNN